MNDRKFLIFAPAYRSDNGGGIVLHRLCSLLNELGYEAYLTRFFNGAPVYSNDFVVPLSRIVARSIWNLISPFKVNPEWHTPIIKFPKLPLGPKWIVVYPEIVFGNPLKAQCVVRWLLHRPGFHTGHMYYGSGEYHVDFNTFAENFCFPDCKMASRSLNVLAFPFEHYNMEKALPSDKRAGTAYCLRKGKGKPLVHDLRNSVLIDGKSHAEVAAILKRVKTFISYDVYTAYSSFAVLCGAESVVIPDSGVDKHAWFPDPADRYGVAYGFDDMHWALETAPLVIGRMKAKEAISMENVAHFAKDVLQYFDN